MKPYKLKTKTPKGLLFVLLLTIFPISRILAQNENVSLYPVQDFYNRTIELPIDYNEPDAGTFFLYYQLTSNFDFNRPTIFFFYDTQQQYGLPGEVDKLAKDHGFFESFNVVRYQMRGRKYSYINFKTKDNKAGWEKGYHILSSKQVVKDIERIRQDLFKDKPDTKIYAFGRSGGAYLVQEYLAEFPNSVERACIVVPPNPHIMKELGYPESKYFYNTVNGIDSSLYKKLETILEKAIVPKTNLLWILKNIPYGSNEPGKEITSVINSLYDGQTNVYESYLSKNRYDFSKLIIPEEKMDAWHIGSYLRVIECSDYFTLPEPDIIDPFYSCLRVVCLPYIKLIESKKVKPISYPSLDSYKKVNTEIFCIMAKGDHVSDYQIGIELSKYYKNYKLFIANDNHMLNQNKSCYEKLRNAFFMHGLESKELATARKLVKCEEFIP